MKVFDISQWLKSPADRDIIAHWTRRGEDRAAKPTGDWYRLALPTPTEDGASWEFVALGDTGDSDAAGPRVSPQEAVAQQMAADCALSNRDGRAAFVVHVGDVVYMTGEHRLYDRNFRRPYRDFLTPESVVDNLIFQIPFLPVPGNHDYYDLLGWARLLWRVPGLGAGLRALTHRLFAFSLPEGGSDMGRAFMEAFMEQGKENPPYTALPYLPGQRTRTPNRYFRFRYGSGGAEADFWALDSNTLDAPPPDTRPVGAVREEAARRLETLDARARTLDSQLARHQRALEAWCDGWREQAAADPAERSGMIEQVAGIVGALGKLQTAVEAVSVHEAVPFRTRARDAVLLAQRRFMDGAAELAEAEKPRDAADAIRLLEEAGDLGCAALREVEGCLAVLPDGTERSALLGARDEADRTLDAWATRVSPAPESLTEPLRLLSEEALDVQRDISLERRRLRYRPEDYDTAQLRWLEEGLATSIAERPDRWRVVYLHHPPYTAIGNHCESSDVRSLRENLLPILQKYPVHLILSGHSHAFEWFRSDALPYTGFFVTGGGGQMTLRGSILEPRRLRRNADRYQALRESGVVEYAAAGRGPMTSDGEDGPLYHFLRVEVTTDALRVRPVGVRRMSGGGYRREEPMPVFYAPALPERRPPWLVRRMEGVEIRRDASPRAFWVSQV